MKRKNCEAPCNVIFSILFLLPVLGSQYCNHHPVVKHPELCALRSTSLASLLWLTPWKEVVRVILCCHGTHSAKHI